MPGAVEEPTTVPLTAASLGRDHGGDQRRLR